MSLLTISCWSLLVCLACHVESASVEHCDADSQDECQDSTGLLQTRTYVNEDLGTNLNDFQQNVYGTGITKVFATSLGTPIPNRISDAKDYAAPPGKAAGVYLDSGIPMPAHHENPKSGLQWPLYGYETDGNGASCRPEKIPLGCKDGVLKTLNLDAKSKVTIPCGECWRLSGAGTIDLPDGLVVHGHLEIADPGAGNELVINTRHVLVLGHLQVRPATTSAMQGKVKFHLMKNLPLPIAGKTELHYVREGCGSNCALGLGHSAFAVVGGSVDLRGFPSSGSSWYRLAATAEKDASSIQIDGDVGDWPVGGEILITSTEFVSAIHGSSRWGENLPSWDQAEKRSISSVSYDSQLKVSTIQLGDKLAYTHWGTIMDFAGYGKAPQIRAEVALLSRQIVIEGPTDAELEDLQKKDNGTFRSHGAHFGVFWTSTPQHIEGVEFRRMGQQGTFGRYPLHLHMCQDHPKTNIIRNSVVDSKQRCYVIHGTKNVTLEENVAHNAIGHCFMLEDGYETGTKLFRNLVSNLKPPKDQPGVDPFEPGFNEGELEDDYTPSGYWIANVDAFLDGNVAAGVCTCAGCDPLLHKCEMCDEAVWGKGPTTSATIRVCAGVWFKMQHRVRRESRFLPGGGSMIRNSLTMGSDENNPRLKNNVMHSNHMGFRYYRPGWRPETVIHEEGQTFYKNYKGVFNHKNQNFRFKNYLFVDNREHLNSDQIDNMVTMDATFVGVSPMSELPGAMCLTAGLSAPRAIQWDGHFYFWSATGLGNSLRHVTFSNFDKQCKDEHGQVVQPITIKLNVESTSAQDWVVEELEQVSLDNTKRLLHFDPYEHGKGQSEIPGQKSYEMLIGSKDSKGRLLKKQYLRSWFLRHRHFYVKDSPTIDPNTAQGVRWWFPQNHWQAGLLGMSFPEYMGCFANKKKWLNMAHNTQAWDANDAPIYMDEQIYKCNKECRKTSAVYFSLRRADNANVKSTNCRCMEKNGQAVPLMKKYQRDWSCGTNEWWLNSGSKDFDKGQQDVRNAIYKIAHSSGKEQCQDFLLAAENMMSCPAKSCARIMRFAWHFDDGTTWTTPSAIHIEDQTASPIHSLYQPGGAWSTASNMLGDGSGNTGAKNAPEAVGTGGISILGGRKYKVQVSKPVGKNSDKWQPTAFRTLKLELFDAREFVPSSLDQPECTVELEIDLQTQWNKSTIPGPKCGAPKRDPNCKLSPTGQSCTLNQAGTSLICNNLRSGHIDIQMGSDTWVESYSNTWKEGSISKKEKKKKQNEKGMPR